VVGLHNLKVAIMNKFLPLFFIGFISASVYAQSFVKSEKSEPDYTNLKPHPRLILTGERVDELKNYLETDTLFQDLMEIIEFYADSALNDPLIAYEFDGPNNPRLKYQRRHAMLRVFNCGLMYQMTGDTVYAARVRDELKSAAAFPDWGPSHYLNIGEISALTGIGYDWVYDYLTEEDKAEIVPGLVKNGLREGVIAYNGDHQNGFWVDAIHNWNQVCNGGLTLLALAVAEEKPDTAKIIVDNAVQSITNAMTSYIPEGAWHEGPTYWAYGTTYNGMLLSALRTTFGHLMGLEEDPGYEPMGKSGLFHIHTAGPTGLYFNYGDSKKTLYYSPVLFWMSREFDEPGYAWFERLTARKDLPRMRTHDLMNDDTLDRFLALLAAWYSDEGQELSYDEFPLDIAISSGETAVGAFHSSWDDDAVYLGFKGGTPNTNHAHMDIGTFVLDAEGERWAMDLGTGDNSLPGYYDRNGKRWDYYRTQNFSHNTLTMMDRLHELNGFADITYFHSDPDYAFAQVNLTELYPVVGKTVRSYEMKDRARVIISDRIEQSFEYLSVRWQMVTDATIELNKSEALLRKNGKVMKVQINQPADAEFSVLSTDPGDDRQRPNEGTRMLAIEYMSMNPTFSEIAVEFIPNDSSLTDFSGSVNVELASTSDLSVYPNPFTDELMFDLSRIQAGNINYKLLDFSGKCIDQGVIYNSGQVSIIKWKGNNISFRELSPGMYVLQFDLNGYSITKKVVKKN
jgi:hypothetical protein